MSINVDRLIIKCNDSTVEKCDDKLVYLSNDELTALMSEYQKHPDFRFGDNLLVALNKIDPRFN